MGAFAYTTITIFFSRRNRIESSIFEIGPATAVSPKYSELWKNGAKKHMPEFRGFWRSIRKSHP